MYPIDLSSQFTDYFILFYRGYFIHETIFFCFVSLSFFRSFLYFFAYLNKKLAVNCLVYFLHQFDKISTRFMLIKWLAFEFALLSPERMKWPSSGGVTFLW
jgi:hypothetical protein